MKSNKSCKSLVVSASCKQVYSSIQTYFSRNVNLDASKRRVKLSHSVLKLANNNDHLEEYFAAFDLDDDTQNEKRVEPKSANESRK